VRAEVDRLPAGVEQDHLGQEVALAVANRGGIVVTLALEYPFWEERLPEALARFGEPILIERGQIKLPCVFRAAGLMTDLCDATDLAQCRMYRSGGELWHRLAKNASEGLGAADLIVPSTLILVFGQVLPVVLVGISLWVSSAAALPAMAALVCSFYSRLAGVVRFRQPAVAALLHLWGS
jgi:hypothetical protein